MIKMSFINRFAPDKPGKPDGLDHLMFLEKDHGDTITPRIEQTSPHPTGSLRWDGTKWVVKAFLHEDFIVELTTTRQKTRRPLVRHQGRGANPLHLSGDVWVPAAGP